MGLGKAWRVSYGAVGCVWGAVVGPGRAYGGSCGAPQLCVPSLSPLTSPNPSHMPTSPSPPRCVCVPSSCPRPTLPVSPLCPPVPSLSPCPHLVHEDEGALVAAVGLLVGRVGGAASLHLLPPLSQVLVPQLVAGEGDGGTRLSPLPPPRHHHEGTQEVPVPHPPTKVPPELSVPTENTKDVPLPLL